MSNSVYLCGSISGMSYEQATGRRNDIHKQLHNTGIEILDPMRDRGFLQGEKNIGLSNNANTIFTAKGTIARDHSDIVRSGVILVNFLGSIHVSIGSIIEITRASQYRKPIIIIMDKDNIHNHGRIKELASFVVPTVGEGIALVKSILNIQ